MLLTLFALMDDDLFLLASGTTPAVLKTEHLKLVANVSLAPYEIAIIGRRRTCDAAGAVCSINRRWGFVGVVLGWLVFRGLFGLYTSRKGARG
jgi:hypothetical protein